MEIETQIMICVRLDYVDREDAKQSWLTTQEVGRMLTRLIQSLSSPQTPSPRP